MKYPMSSEDDESLIQSFHVLAVDNDSDTASQCSQRQQSTLPLSDTMDFSPIKPHCEHIDLLSSDSSDDEEEKKDAHIIDLCSP